MAHKPDSELTPTELKRRQYMRDWKAIHKEEQAQKDRERYLAKITADPEYNKKQYQKHREKAVLGARRYRQEHKEEVSAKDKARYPARKDKLSAQKKVLYQEQRQVYIDKAEEWHREHPEKANGYYRKYHTGCDTETYDRLNKEQGGKCAICGGVNDRGHSLCADHDHKTGLIRGLLCRTCNLGIGHLQDDPALLRKAADYIEHHR